nr:MAG TPA: hypothetical protein [Caudoviricetes sp.]
MVKSNPYLKFEIYWKGLAGFSSPFFFEFERRLI